MNKNIARLLSIFAAVTALSSPANIFAAESTAAAVSQNQLPAEEVGKYGMVPIYGFDVKDGTYSISVDSSSSMFRVTDAQLTVKNGEMTARITLSGTGYSMLYQGTGQEAAVADPKKYSPYIEDTEGRYSYEITVPALNAAFPCAGFSQKKQQWYDRNLLFDASSLPEGTIAFALPDYDRIQEAMALLEASDAVPSEENKTTAAEMPQEEQVQPAAEAVVTEPLVSDTAMEMDMDDGEYSIEMYLEGGSGKATVVTPNILTVKNGRAYATLQWSSSNYDYMIVGNEKYLNQAAENANSLFQIPVTAMDESIPVIGDTTAMGDAHEVSYTVTFFRDSIGSKSQLPQEAAKRVLLIAFAVIIVGGILNHIIKKKNRA